MKTLIALGLGLVLIIAIAAEATNEAIAQVNQLARLEQYANLRGAEIPSYMPATIDSFKVFLAAQISLDEQGNDPSNPVNSTVNNPDLANLDTQILNYLCAIDTTYCADGDNYPLSYD
jgi:hypothetical protein